LNRENLKDRTEAGVRRLRIEPARTGSSVLDTDIDVVPQEIRSENVRLLTRHNFHRVLEATCLVPGAMGFPLPPRWLEESETSGSRAYPGDEGAHFIDGGYTLKMPMALFHERAEFRRIASWLGAEKTVVFCCDPAGQLWETSSRLRSLNQLPALSRAVAENRLLVVYPDHPIAASFLCTDNSVAMRTFNQGRDQAVRFLRTEKVRRFLEESAAA
jgi:hypothetical protein